MQTFAVTVNGTTYEVAIEDSFASPVLALVNGERYRTEVTMSPAQPEPAASEAPPRAPILVAVAAPAPVFAPAVTPAVGGGSTVAAPMPGKVLAILVQAGDAVKRGDEVLTLEAMKMAMAVRSSADGTVSAVRVSVGQAVKHGEVLLVVG
jgi:glutaconyl-CoA/methylmalonyl-CoA decarboxylase subunit gamma